MKFLGYASNKPVDGLLPEGLRKHRRKPKQAPDRPATREGADLAVTQHDHCSSDPSPDEPRRAAVSLAEFQDLIRRMYLEKDVARGIDGTFMWLMEEVGELAAVLRKGTHEERRAEFADVLAWLATIANVAGVDLSDAVMRKYGSGCPGCGQFVCVCPNAGKP